MLPYFRSMEAFFNLSLPKSWADLSDPQLLFFFRQLATDKPMADFQGVPFSSFISHRQHPLHMEFPRQLRPLPSPLPTHLRHRVLHPPHRGISDTKHHRHREQHTFSQGQRIR